MDEVRVPTYRFTASIDGEWPFGMRADKVSGRGGGRGGGGGGNTFSELEIGIEDSQKTTKALQIHFG